MVKKSSLMSKVLVLIMAFAVVFTYSVMPVNSAFAASAKKPAKVTIKSAKAVSAASVKVTWKKAKNAKKYQVYASVKKKSGFKNVATVKSSKKSATVKNLKAGTKYYFKVRALNGKKKGKFSKVKSAKTLKQMETAADFGRSKTATITTEIDMSKYDAGKVVKVWVPVPQTDIENGYQVVSNESFSANKAKEAKFTESEGNKMLYVEWDASTAPADRKATLTFTAKRFDIDFRGNLQEEKGAGLTAEAEKYVNKESQYVNISDPVVKKYAKEAVKGAASKSTLDRTRSIYEWVINNLARLDNGEKLGSYTFGVEGCGYGNTKKILGEFDKYGISGGHCTDLNSTFVALCRANGIAAREMFGIRLGNDGENITGYQHCWAEFYLPGTGWVYADPADVLKAIKPAKSADNQIDVDEWKAAKASDKCKERTEFFWCHVDNNRVVLSRGRDVTFNPPQAWGTCNTFGYPAAEVGGERMPADFTNGPEFKYTITSKAVLPDFVNMDVVEWLGFGTDQIKSDDYIIDVRTPENFAKGRLAGSVNVPVSKGYTEAEAAAIKAEYDKAAGKRVVIICNTGNALAKNAMAALQAKGADINNVTFLIGGAETAQTMPEWTLNDFINMGDEWKTYGTSDITDKDLVVDVRKAEDFAAGHIAGAVSVPTDGGLITAKSEAAKGLDSAFASASAEGKRVVLICYSGNKFAKRAMDYLYNTKAGVDKTKVTYLIGGFNGWMTTKPYVIGEITVDPSAKTASFKATVNKDFVSEPKSISHLVLSRTGGMAPNAPFLTDAEALDLYDALIGIGAVPWSTSEKTFGEDETGKKLTDVAGDNANFSYIDITVDGQPLASCLRYKKAGADASAADAVKMAFSGNKANQTAWKTGCVSCAFSCYAGIVSNAAVGMGTTSEADNYFFVDNAKLKGDQEVTLVYTVK